MSNFFRAIIRASSFFRKEIFEILRQPRLVATLVVGPFLILFIFGIGYRSQLQPLRTLFVTPPDSPITAEDIQKFEKSMGTLLFFSGVATDQNEALDQLKRGQVDLVIVVPEDAVQTIKNDQQAVFRVYHNQIDPVQVNYIDHLGGVLVGQVNNQVLRSFVVQGQKDAVDLRTYLQEAHTNVAAMREAVQNGDETLAQEKRLGLASNLDTVSQAVDVSMSLLDSLQQTRRTNEADANPVQNSLTDLRQNTDQLSDSSTTKDERLARLDKIDNDITNLDGRLEEFQIISSSIIVSPFGSETISATNNLPSPSHFFAPAVLALLLQHLAITFAALSIVRERNVGTMELFRVSPLSSGEALFGKFISYMLFGGVIAAILSALLVFTLHVPMLGNWWNFTLVIAAVLFTSLGIGFVISIVSQTDSQAVQYSMITLLASVFFSGFIMSLDMLWEPVRVISYLLPTTYGTLMLRDIALRGMAPDWDLLAGLIGMGLVLMLVSWQLMRRLIRSKQ